MKNYLLLALFLTSLLVCDAYGIDCNYKQPPKNILLGHNVDVNISVWVSGKDCESALVSLRIHSVGQSPNKPLYVVDNYIGTFFGSRALNVEQQKAASLANELLQEISVKYPVGVFDPSKKCLVLIPDAYLKNLRAKKAEMFSYRWRSQEVRYIAYITEIDQFVNIAQCSNKPQFLAS